ncbi:universal stress protein [Streptomyces sp. NPDC085529]|uniref:universal stress protein n=1 Tax=Streptomyces sp. NPDC085529 TaxID=3365729 RepID=UPI0037D0477F
MVPPRMYAPGLMRRPEERHLSRWHDRGPPARGRSAPWEDLPGPLGAGRARRGAGGGRRSPRGGRRPPPSLRVPARLRLRGGRPTGRPAVVPQCLDPARLVRLASRWPPACGPASRTCCRRGARRTAEAVVESAARQMIEASRGAGLVVVGRRTRRLPAGPHLGHVAHAVIHHSPAPVAVVPPGLNGV